MKPKKVIILVITIALIALLGFAGRFLYQIACISCTIPPIKTYTYVGGIDQFEAGINNFTTNNPGITCKLTAKTGTVNRGFGYYITVYIRDPSANITGDIKYQVVQKTDVKEVDVELIGLFDENNSGKGGYSLRAKDMDKLLTDFDRLFITALNKKQHMVLTPSK